MTDTVTGFATRPGAAERWIRRPVLDTPAATPFSARLTIDVTPAMRQRLKLAAVTRGTTVADLMRALIDAQFPDTVKEPI
ncbi:hypothetical protein J2W40_001655 [Sphingobium xenophagum]|uniref:Plasmid segregation centromere-binding protein ParG n=1 Tax=Sphingobium xenophagum TaxID=121428 RepID=A0ABU1WZU0_SPHXE|nr:hypothetical protein [Sphingobium xenophagum]MDR7154840.1 hypothetical protein [Sphingobium xenophagum]